MAKIPTLKLNTGAEIPQLGFGTWLLEGKQGQEAITKAIEVGYRHIDTAQAYKNEKIVGDVIKASGIPRKDFFITTKIHVDNLGNELFPSFEQSLNDLGMDYIDLLLIHFPLTISRRPAWFKMEEIYESGRAKAIGVSNYMVHHLEELFSECEIKPAVNQYEMHVFHQRPELLKYCKDHGMVVEAYSPLARARRMDKADVVLEKIGNKYGKSKAQVMIRWCLEQGIVTIPRSHDPKHIAANYDVFDFNLDKDDLAEIKKLDRNFVVSWDPTHVP